MTRTLAGSLMMGLLFVALAAGCGSGDGAATGKTVEERVINRWNYLAQKEAGKAYDYLTPGFRKVTTREQYAATMANRTIHWKSAKVTKKECDEEVCEVFVYLDYEVTMAGAGGKPIQALAPIREKWMKVDGKWYFLPEN